MHSWEEKLENQLKFLCSKKDPDGSVENRCMPFESIPAKNNKVRVTKSLIRFNSQRIFHKNRG